jgi:MFS transporter, ACS family, pantothenate transporter
MGNDLAYVVQAVAPNFVWKTTDFPRARKGYTWSVVLQVLLGEFALQRFENSGHTDKSLVLLTATIQLLLWRDKRKAARTEAVDELPGYEGSDSPQLEGSDYDEKKAIRAQEASL